MAEAKLLALVEANTKQLENALKRVERLATDSFRRQEQSAKSLDNTMARMGATVNTLGRGFGGLRSAVQALAGGLFIREVLDYADAWTVAGNQIKAAGQISGVSVRSLQQLNDIATQTRSGFDETVRLYSRLVRASQGLNVSEQQLAAVTKTVNEAFVAGGAVTSERIAGVLQLSQAISSGLLQGDELRSIRETAPLLAQALADEFKTTIGGLKELGAQGQITSDRIISAITKAGPEIHAAFATTVPTVSDSITLLNNAFIELVGSLNEAGQITPVFVKELMKLSAWIRQNKELFADYNKLMTFMSMSVAEFIAAQSEAVGKKQLANLDTSRIEQLTKRIDNLRASIKAAQDELKKAPSAGWLDELTMSNPTNPRRDQLKQQIINDMRILQQEQEALEGITGKRVDEQRALAIQQREDLEAERALTDDFHAATENLVDVTRDMVRASEALGVSAKDMANAMSRQGDFATSIAQVPEAFRAAIVSAAKEFDIPANLLTSILQAESGFDPDVISGKRKSSAGAIGIAQFMPGTAKQYGVNPYEPISSIRGAAHYLKDLITHFNGDFEAAIAAYNAGQGTVDDFLAGRRKSLPAETQAYVPKVMKGIPTLGERTAEQEAADKEAARKAKEAQDAADALAKSKADIELAARRDIEALGLEARAFGQNTFEAEKAKQFQDLLNQATDAGIAITDEYRAHLMELAAAHAQATVVVEDAGAAHEKAAKATADANQNLVQSMDELRSFSSDVLGGFISDMIHGKTAAEALQGALAKIADKLLDIGVNMLIGGLFGPQGSTGGGLFGTALSSLFAAPAAAAPFSLAAAPLAGGGVFGPQGMVPLRRYATGGVANSPQMAVYGEGSKPEAFVPLPDGRRIPVHMNMPRFQGGDAGRHRTDVHNVIDVKPSELFAIQVESRVRAAQAETFSSMPAYLDERRARMPGSMR